MSRTATESRKLNEVASAYSAEGYEVLVEPAAGRLPVWLRGFRPDLIARRDDDCVVVEIKSARSVKADDNVRRLTDAIEEHPDWRFELVMIRPSGKGAGATSVPAGPLLPPDHLAEYAQAASQMADSGFLEPAFLTAWVLFETAYRYALEHDAVDPTRLSASSVLKTLLSLGYVASRDEVAHLDGLWRLRNSLAHGYMSDQRPTLESISFLVQLSRRLIAIATGADEPWPASFD
jgi:hypothetical protein